MGPERSGAATKGNGIRLHPGIGGARATPQGEDGESRAPIGRMAEGQASAIRCGSRRVDLSQAPIAITRILFSPSRERSVLSSLFSGRGFFRSAAKALLGAVMCERVRFP